MHIRAQPINFEPVFKEHRHRRTGIAAYFWRPWQDCDDGKYLRGLLDYVSAGKMNGKKAAELKNPCQQYGNG